MIRRVASLLVVISLSTHAQQTSSGAAATGGVPPQASDTSPASRSLFLGGAAPTADTGDVHGRYATPGGIAAPCSANTAANNNTVTGGGRAFCNQWQFINNGWGRNVGSSYQPHQASQWQVSHFFNGTLYSHTAGISEYWTETFNAMNGGDKSMQRWWFNYLPGNTEDGSGEGAKGMYFAMMGIGDYVGTVNAGYRGKGLPYIETTGTCSHKGFGGTSEYCIGSPRPIIQPEHPLFTANVTAQVLPTANTYGTLTLDVNALPETPHGVLAGPIPDTTNYKDGSGFTITYKPVTGTMPASGLLCAVAPNGVRPETLTYTLTGSTLTVTGGHRDPLVSGNPAKAPITAWAGACKGFVSNPDVAVDGKKALWWYLGNTSSNTIAYVAYDRGAMYGGALGSSVSSFRAGVAGSNSITAYQTAEVIATYNATAGPGTQADGSMWLAENDMKWEPKTQVEMVFTPSSRAILMDLHCAPGSMSTDGLNTCISIGLWAGNDAAIDIPLWNPIADTTAGSGQRAPIPDIFRVRPVTSPATLGVYNDLFDLAVAPQRSLFNVRCQAGDTSVGCKNSAGYDLFVLSGANGGGRITWLPQYGALSFAGMDVVLGANRTIGFWSNANANASTGAMDTALTRTAPNTVALGNGKQGDTSGTLTLRSVQLTSASLPCTAKQKGQFNYIEGGKGVKDTVQVCAKDAKDAWAWRTLY